MRLHAVLVIVTSVAAAILTFPSSADAQVLKRLRDAAKNAATREAENQVQRAVRNAIRCAVDDPVCHKQAKDSGKDVVFVDSEGEIITDDEGVPITDPNQAKAAARPPVAPGQGAWANYDFVPGEEILLYDDYSNDRVGDFPRRFELIQGNFEIVEWEGDRYLRATSNGILAIPLPKTLPERFTVEYAVHLEHGNAYVRVMPGRAYYGPVRDYRGSVASVELTQAGIRPATNQGPTAMSSLGGSKGPRDAVVPVRIMADGDHMKMYLAERRVANAPNAIFPRSNSLFIAVSYAAERHPILIGPIRIAGGGRELYDRLARDGRVATQGILFATNSDRIRPESTPTLEEIGTMLKQHDDLRITIEGHTDSDGEEAYNQDLSERRAASVKRFIVERYGIEPSRLETAGFGESRPVADNSTPEGKQQNRRVELVKIND